MKYNNYGPIGEKFIAHFDTQNAGPKREPDSYEKIKSEVKAGDDDSPRTIHNFNIC